MGWTKSKIENIVSVESKQIHYRSFSLEFSVTGVFFFIAIQRGKEGIKNINYHLDIGTTSACTNMTVKSTKGLG